MRHSNKTIKEVIRLTREKHSLNQISEELNIPKSTAYYHFRKIRGKTFKQAKIGFASKKEEGEALGIFAGDGSLCFVPKRHYYFIRIHLGKEDYAKKVCEKYSKCFQKKFRIAREGNRRIVCTYSKKIYQYFLSKLDFEPKNKAAQICLKEYPRDNSFKKGFLSGLLDTDGTITRNAIAYYTISKRLADQASQMLFELCIQNSIYKGKKRPGANYPLYTIKILSGSRSEFIKKISSHKVKRLMEQNGLVDQR